MALIKKCDVNDYFAAKRRTRLHSLKPANQPAGKEPGFAKDFLGEHSTLKNPLLPDNNKGRGAL